MTDNKMERAMQVYHTLCSALDNRGWRYERNEDKLLVRFGVRGDDIPLEFVILVDADRQLVRLLSPLAFKMNEDKRLEGAIATCAVSYRMADGSFDYDLSDGEIVFRMTSTYRESQLGEGIFHYMISCACAMVDKYNDQFLALDRGLLSISDFIQRLAL